MKTFRNYSLLLAYVRYACFHSLLAGYISYSLTDFLSYFLLAKHSLASLLSNLNQDQSEMQEKMPT